MRFHFGQVLLARTAYYCRSAARSSNAPARAQLKWGLNAHRTFKRAESCGYAHQPLQSLFKPKKDCLKGELYEHFSDWRVR